MTTASCRQRSSGRRRWPRSRSSPATTPKAVTGLEWDGDGEQWKVTVDVLELERIPNTTDVMAAYDVQLDEQGTLRGYRRTRRFLRGAAEGA